MKNTAEENKKTGEQPKSPFPEKYNAQVAVWKQNHRVKYFDCEGIFLFFRMPTRPEMAAAENLATDDDGKMDVYKKAEKLLVDCYLGGDLSLEKLLDNIEVYMAAAEFVLYRLVAKKKTNWGDC